MISCFAIQPRYRTIQNLDDSLRLENINEALKLVKAVGKLYISNYCEINMKKISPATFFSTNFLQDLASSFIKSPIDLLFINYNISPIQQRNLERFLKLKVIDRTGLILEIFSERATSFEGRLQVDLARFNYHRSRLVRSWTHLERQRGGIGFLGGPGETQIESDKRQLDLQIRNTKIKLKTVEKTRRLHQKSRKSLEFPFVTLVGYTNVGKSSLFNRLTKSNNLEKDMLFATLDATARSVTLPSSKKIILSDTVGFISNLPTQLIKSFKSTLEEVVNADLILHIIDVSSPFYFHERNEVTKVLKELNIDRERTKVLEVGNKVDLVKNNESIDTSNLSLTISAKSDENLESVLRLIDLQLAKDLTKESITLKFCEGHKRSWLMRNKLVQNEEFLDGGIRVDVRWTSLQKSKFSNLD